MKHLTIIISLLLVIFNSQAQTQQVFPLTEVVHSAELVSFDIHHESLRNVTSGRVEISETEIILTLQEPWSCPDELVCATVMPTPQKITLPVTDIYEDGCGTMIYIAESYQLPIGGPHQIIEVQDYSAIRCRVVMPYPTNIQYRTLNHWLSLWTVSTFDANSLVRIDQGFSATR